MENYVDILTPSVEKRREVDLIPKENRTWEEKMIYAICHSEIVDERYFKSDSGEPFALGDKRLNCYIKETIEDEEAPIYRSITIKSNQIGKLYDLINDKFSERGHIVVKLIK